MQEVWKDMPGFETCFRISNLGNIFSKRRNHILKTHITNGYARFTTYVGGKRFNLWVHRIVASAFLEPPPDDLVVRCSKEHYGVVLVRHKDNNRLNNVVTNLEWGSSQDNSDDWTRTDGYDKVYEKIRGTANVHAKFTEEDVRYIRANYKPRDAVYGSRALAKRFGVNHRTIRMIIKRRTYSNVD